MRNKLKTFDIRHSTFRLYLCILFSVFCFLFSVKGISQNYLSLETDYFYGNIMEHRSSIKHLIKGHPEGIIVTFNKQTFGEKQWEALYNYPDYGLSFTYQDMKNEVLGKQYSLYGHLTFYFLNRHLALRIAQGVTYNTNPYDKDTNFRNVAYGTRFMPSTYFMLNYKKQNLYKSWGFQTGISLHHYSNARIKAPNTSTNTIAFNFGLNYDFNSENPEYTTYEKENFTEQIKYNFAFRSGVSSSPIVGMKSFPFYVFSAYADKRISRKSAVQLGADLFLMEYVKEYIYFHSVAYPEGYQNPDVDYKRIGIFGGYEMFLSKLTLEGHFGYYLYAPFPAEAKVYQRIGMKYYFSDKIFGGTSLKTHMAKAEALEFSVGIRL